MPNQPSAKSCPECGDQIQFRAKAHSCGWRETTPRNARNAGSSTAQASLSVDYWRCSFELPTGERCRYVGSCSRGQTGEGARFCSDHAVASSDDDNAAILARSHLHVEDGMDYSSAASLRLWPEKAQPQLDLEADVAVEYPRTHHRDKNWACRIVRLSQIGGYSSPAGVHVALDALGLRKAADLQAKFPPYDHQPKQAQQPQQK